MDAYLLTSKLKERARELGFDLVGATPAVAPPEIEHLEKWMADGLAADMTYFSERIDAYRDPNLVLPGVKSVLMLSVNYRTTEPAAAGFGQGKISRYAWGTDYHEVVRRWLYELADFHRELAPNAQVRGIVDTAPFLERAFAQRAGLGWIGKNNLLINEKFGSWIFLAALLTTEELEYDDPTFENNCGDCRMCLDACPTGALAAPYRLDARKCVSYLTIESKGDIPQEFQKACGDRLFGCDSCQEACPWNRDTPISKENAFQPREGMNPADLAALMTLDEAEFKRRFRDTPLWRIKLSGVLRNAAMIIANNTSRLP